VKERVVVLLTTVPELHGSTRDLATQLARRSNAVLLFLYVVPLCRSLGEGMLHDAVQVSSLGHRRWLDRQRSTSPAVPSRHRLVVGDPEEVVRELESTLDLELVVVEEARRSWLGVPLTRGLGERLVHQLATPVVIVGPYFTERAAAPAPAPAVRAELSEVMALLNGLVDARVEALRCRLDQTRDAAARLAALRVVGEVLQISRRREVPEGAVRQLTVALDEHARALRAISWVVIGPRDRWGHDGVLPGVLGMGEAFLRRLDQVSPCVSLPLALDGDRLVQLAGARVPGVDGGRLILVFDAADDFLRILGQPGPLPSLETYAFNDCGVMLSNSLFPHDLLAAGLLPSEGSQTALRLRVAEPSEGPPEAWPLTHMAAHAVRHQDGWDTRGYLDYRGTAVVGAWRWVDEHGFGVTAEVDQAVVLR
jgi:hypothetical protein